MPETRIHRHHQYLVEVGQDFFQHSRGSCGVNRYSGAFAQRSDTLHGAMQIVVALLVNQTRVAPGFGEFVEKQIRVGNHQVSLERQARHPPERVHDRRTNRDVGNKMSVHHIDVDSIGSGSLSFHYLLAEARKVGS